MPRRVAAPSRVMRPEDVSSGRTEWLEGRGHLANPLHSSNRFELGEEMRQSTVVMVILAMTAGAYARAADEPEVFEPRVISGAAHDSAPAFSPDGRDVYFGRGSGTS